MPDVEVLQLVAVAEDLDVLIGPHPGQMQDLDIGQKTDIFDVQPPDDLGLRELVPQLREKLIVDPAVVQQEIAAALQQRQRAAQLIHALVAYGHADILDALVLRGDELSEKLEAIGEADLREGVLQFLDRIPIQRIAAFGVGQFHALEQRQQAQSGDRFVELLRLQHRQIQGPGMLSKLPAEQRHRVADRPLRKALAQACDLLRSQRRAGER